MNENTINNDMTMGGSMGALLAGVIVSFASSGRVAWARSGLRRIGGV